MDISKPNCMLKLNLGVSNDSELIAPYKQSVAVGELTTCRLMALAEMRENLRSRLSIVKAPLYFGEAERFLLMPLRSELVSISGDGGSQVPADPLHNIATSTFATTAAYAIIEEIAKLSMPKDLANALSFQMIQGLPIVQRLLLAGLYNQQAMPTTTPVTTLDEKGGVSITGRSVDCWNRVLEQLGHIKVDDASRTADAFSIMSSVYSLGDMADHTQTVGDLFTDLSRWTRYGKGFPLSDGERSQFINQRLLDVFTRIDEIGSNVSLDPANNLHWCNYLIAYNWFSTYLNAIEDYDAIFPAGIIQTQSSAWVMSLKTSAAKMKAFYLRMSLIPLSNTVELSLNFWKDTYALVEKMLPKTSASEDLISLFSEIENSFIRVSDDWSRSVSDDTFARLKSYLDVDILLNREWGGFAITVDQMRAKAAAGAMSTVPTGLKAAYSLNQITPRGHVDEYIREQVLVYLSDMATNLKAGAAAMVQVTNFINGYKPDLGAEPFPQPKSLMFSTPAERLSIIPQLVPLTKTDPNVNYMYKYYHNVNDAGSESMEWTLTPVINSPDTWSNIANMAMIKDGTSLYWGNTHASIVAEPIIKESYVQPIWSELIQRINPTNRPASWDEWARLVDDANPLSRFSQLKRFATAIATDPQRYATAVTNALAAVCGVWFKRPGGKSWEHASNLAPAWFGYSPDIIFSRNGEPETSTQSTPFFHSSRDWVEHVALGDQEWVIAFRLWDELPQQEGEVAYTMYSMFRGSYMLIPIWADLLDRSSFFAPSLGGHIQWKPQDDIDWIKVKFWAPYSMPAPHLMWDANHLGTDVPCDIYNYVRTRVSWEIDNLDRSLSFRASHNSEVVVYEVSDRDSAMSQPDPSPLCTPTIAVPDPVVEGGDIKPSGDQTGTVTPSLGASGPNGINASAATIGSGAVITSPGAGEPTATSIVGLVANQNQISGSGKTLLPLTDKTPTVGAIDQGDAPSMAQPIMNAGVADVEHPGIPHTITSSGEIFSGAPEAIVRGMETGIVDETPVVLNPEKSELKKKKKKPGEAPDNDQQDKESDTNEE